MIINSQSRSFLLHYPYQLVFGTDCSPRLLPHTLLNDLVSIPQEPDIPEYIGHASLNTKRLAQSLKSVSAAPKKYPTPETPKYSPQKPGKLHGNFVGPYSVQKILSASSVLILNLVSHSSLKTSVHLIKPCHSHLPPAILDAYVAADSSETFLDAILKISNNTATILWSDGTTTKQTVSSVKNTSAYSRCLKLSDPPASKKRGRKKKRQC
ncbi:hypothetical protein P9112_013357 [Eukaryota sp. TZLM1-RC]